jgi:hypothetical protein
MVRPDLLRDLLGVHAFVEGLLLEREREGVDRPVAGALGEVGDGAGIDPAGQKHAQRHVGRQVNLHAMQQLRAQRLKRDRHARARHGPVGVRQRLPPARIELADLARPDRFDAAHHGAGRGDKPVPHHARRAGRIEAGLADESGAEDRPHFRGEDERPVAVGVGVARQVERLDAVRIARHGERTLFRIPQAEGEHPAQAGDRFGPVFGEHPQHDGRVAGGSERLARLLQFAAQLDVVVDLAVKDDRLPAGRVGHRLVGGRREVEDRQPAMRQQTAEAGVVAWRFEEMLAVGPAVRHAARHVAQRLAVAIVDPSDDSGDAAHSVLLA